MGALDCASGGAGECGLEFAGGADGACEFEFGGAAAGDDALDATCAIAAGCVLARPASSRAAEAAIVGGAEAEVAADATFVRASYGIAPGGTPGPLPR